MAAAPRRRLLLRPHRPRLRPRPAALAPPAPARGGELGDEVPGRRMSPHSSMACCAAAREEAARLLGLLAGDRPGGAELEAEALDGRT